MTETVNTTCFYVSPTGDDRWSGLAPQRKGKGNDGPFRSVERARRAVRALKKRGQLANAVKVVLRGGTHFLRKPLTLTHQDSGMSAPTDNWGRQQGPKRTVTYAAYPGEEPILSGGVVIKGFKPTRVNGQRAWVTRLPQVARGAWFFSQLWVNGRRATRTRWPHEGLLRIEEPLGEVVWEGDVHKVLFTGQDRFRFRAGDLRAWSNVKEIEFVALHFWIESRVPMTGIDVKTREAAMAWRTRMRLTDDFSREGAQYYLENIFEELKEPGQWYLDRPSGKLYYLPLPGEKIGSAQVIAPRLEQLLVLKGDQEAGKPVEYVDFEGITFSHSEWRPGEAAHRATPQAACHVEGALSLQHARKCEIRSCRLTHLGSYAVELSQQCSDVTIAGNRITDLAAGGVKIWHSQPEKAKATSGGSGPDMTWSGSCRRIVVCDNEIADGGHRWRQAVGVLIGKCSGNRIEHNDIHDFDYTGVSVGWTWGYAESHAYGNIIEHNHIHHIGRGVLSDMGAIYTLGVSPGTRLRYNLIHDVESRGYGGWGIYLDEGSSDILVERNVVYRTKSNGFHQHYGRENLVRNNIFALGREAQLARSRLEGHRSFFFLHNVVLSSNGGQMASGNWSELSGVLDSNLYYDLGKAPLRFGGKSWRQWRQMGADRKSIIADPRFRSVDMNDFRLRPDSPAAKIGFEPFTMAAGPRPGTLVEAR